MEKAVENFRAFTGASEEIAQRYLGLTDNNPELAIQLFFDSPDLASVLDDATIEANRRPAPKNDNIINLDSDSETLGDENAHSRGNVASAARAPQDYEDDESIARRIQAELYQGSSGTDDVRAPIERRTETLVGGADSDWDEDAVHSSVLQQLRGRSYARTGVFNQAPVPSIWDQSSDESARRQGLAEATGGASETSSKAARLAELFRPPFEIMRQVPWETARDQGKEEGKWILVNVQDPSIFDCQQLNRDIWKHPGIKEAVKEHFVFVQYSKDDSRGSQYIQFYFQNKNSDAAYPHIAIVDPRTGEQVKIWSGRPVPRSSDFLMQLYEFLDRYSLDMTKKNPVARRKPEDSKSVHVEQLSEAEMLDLALHNSLTNGTVAEPKQYDPDDLTKNPEDFSKGKGKEVASEFIVAKSGDDSPSDTLFAKISSTNPHIEPPLGAGATRIQFKHASGRIVRAFKTDEPVRRIYEWLKSEPIDGQVDFELKVMGMSVDLIDHLDETIEECGLKNGTVMVEFLQSDD